MKRRRLQRWAAVMILAIMAVLTLEGVGLFEAGHDDCADSHGHDVCVCVCACHSFSMPSGAVEVAPPTAEILLFASHPPATGILVPTDIFRPPLA